MMDNCTGGSLLQIGQSDNTIDKKMLKIPGTRIQSDTAAGSFGGAVGLIFFHRIQLFQSDSIRINSDTAMMVATRLLMESLMDSNSI